MNPEAHILLNSGFTDTTYYLLLITYYFLTPIGDRQQLNAGDRMVRG